MPKILKYNDNDVFKAIAENYSIAGVLRSLDLIAAGGNYKTINKFIKDKNVNTDHFTGQGHLKGKSHNWSPKKDLKDILVEGCDYNSSNLRKRLIQEGYKDEMCESCQGKEWQGHKIPLELDHINGIHTDNRIENIRLICPNCHALTPTYRGKNIRSRPDNINYCIDCRTEIHKSSKRCSKCNRDNTKSVHKK